MRTDGPWSPFGGSDNRFARCPISKCVSDGRRYEFPLDLERAAMSQHACSHSREEWGELLRGMAADLSDRRAAQEEWEAFWLGEMERAKQWAQSATEAR